MPIDEPPSLPPELPHRFGAMQHRNFRLYFWGHLTSLIGWAMHSVAQPWLVLVLTNSAFYVGLVAAVGTLPILLFSLHAGLAADRFPKRRLLTVTQSTAMVVAVTLGIVVVTDAVQLYHVMIAAALLGVAAAFDVPGRNSFLVELVGKRDLMGAIALNSAAFNGSRIVGPAVAGVLIGAVGVGVCFLLNGVSYLALLAGLLFMRFPGGERAGATGDGRSSIRDGLAYIRTHPRLRTLLLMVATASVFGFPFHTLMPVIARQELGVGAREFGWMVSSAALGALTAALGLATFAREIAPGGLVRIAAPTFGALVAVLGSARSLGAMLVLLVLAGFFQVAFTASTNTLLQSAAADAFRGRVMSLYSLAFLGLLPIGNLIAGVVAERFGPVTWLVGSGVVCAVLMAVGASRLPRDSVSRRRPSARPR